MAAIPITAEQKEVLKAFKIFLTGATASQAVGTIPNLGDSQQVRDEWFDIFYELFHEGIIRPDKDGSATFVLTKSGRETIGNYLA